MRGIIVAIVTSLALLGGATTGFAEQGDGHRGSRDGRHHDMRGHGPRDPAMMVERMSRHLDLDELQQEKLKNIMLAAKPELDALRVQARANRQAQKELDTSASDYSASLAKLAAESGEIVASRMVLMGRIRGEINAELTEEQRAKLAERGAHRGKGRHNRDSGTDQ
ncbi:MAG: Spy/CpxP family protein refolding chaperone [Proteobacteria bacterium]|nr:Spy/CpxP family protein refolding chaperone [Pseudomonadota bacterium]